MVIVGESFSYRYFQREKSVQHLKVVSDLGCHQFKTVSNIRHQNRCSRYKQFKNQTSAILMVFQHLSSSPLSSEMELITLNPV